MALFDIPLGPFKECFRQTWDSFENELVIRAKSVQAIKRPSYLGLNTTPEGEHHPIAGRCVGVPSYTYYPLNRTLKRGSDIRS